MNNSFFFNYAIVTTISIASTIKIPFYKYEKKISNFREPKCSLCHQRNSSHSFFVKTEITPFIIAPAVCDETMSWLSRYPRLQDSYLCFCCCQRCHRRRFFKCLVLPITRRWYDISFLEFITHNTGVRVNHRIKFGFVVFVAVAIVNSVPDIFCSQLDQKLSFVETESDSFRRMINGFVGDSSPWIEPVLMAIFFGMILDTIHGRRVTSRTLLSWLDCRYKRFAFSVVVYGCDVETPR
mmetsp:Transcript_20639/g.44933  ORF Transcript_20639/g.44933 Transcript_20639/m.44933 type:complete len:238 (-) Transcript_20639:739-1452(-)